jgi:hypothetical protein
MWNRIGTIALAGLASVSLSCVLHAQAAPQAGTAKSAGASATASAPSSPRDFSGVWNMHALPAQRKFLGSTYTAEPPDMTPWGSEKYMSYKPSNGPRTHTLQETDDPVLKLCLPPGTPRIYLQPFPFQIVMTPKEMIMIFEYDHTIRQIFMDGRPHPEDITPTYMGHSIGKWDGDTLEVDTVGFNERTWLDRDGHPHSDQLHVVERFHKTDGENMVDDITIEDPKALLKPWKTQLNFQLKAGWDIMELACTDNVDFVNFEK